MYALVIGIPGALLISELTSLITAKLAGFGILRHQFTFSGSAALWTVIGICGIKMLARFVLCIKLWKKGRFMNCYPVNRRKKSACIFRP